MQPFSPCGGGEGEDSDLSKNNPKDQNAVFFLSTSFLPLKVNLRLAPDCD